MTSSTKLHVHISLLTIRISSREPDDQRVYGMLPKKKGIAKPEERTGNNWSWADIIDV